MAGCNKPTPIVDIAIALLRNAAGHFYIQRRAETAHQGNRWEFPGGKVEAGETTDAALIREVAEECGVSVCQATLWRRIEHDYGDTKVRLHLYLVDGYAGQPASREGLVWRWCCAQALLQLDWPAANRQFIHELALIEDDPQSTEPGSGSGFAEEA